MKDYLSFQADLDDPKTVAAYDEPPLWSAMFGLILLKHLPLSSHLEVLDPGEQQLMFDSLEAELNLLAGSRGGLTLSIPMAYVEAHRIGRNTVFVAGQ
jgi:hypothetical protein